MVDCSELNHAVAHLRQHVENRPVEMLRNAIERAYDGIPQIADAPAHPRHFDMDALIIEGRERD